MTGLEGYEYEADPSFHSFKFDSYGPRGKITKEVRFELLIENYYNLSFGDLDLQNRKLNDKAVSNNSDTVKIFFTIASIINDFTKKFADTRIFFTGNTDSRNRLYRMLIRKYWNIIDPLFMVDGFQGNKTETFKFNRQYDFFAISRRRNEL